MKKSLDYTGSASTFPFPFPFFLPFFDFLIIKDSPS